MPESYPNSERDLDDAGVRRLFAAVLASALADALGLSFLGQGPAGKRRAAKAREWLESDPRAETVCRLAGRDPSALREILAMDPEALRMSALNSGG